ncbi:MAG: hypothetical protein KatS3mg110_4062 [Pirellulaceae bacterium]|nr:MAG: hypothetical protein KatS3mg110_4062 [Pirellulaceae bacterium]
MRCCIVCAVLACVVALVSRPLWSQATVDDLVAGYQTNAAKFRTLRVLWERKFEETPAVKARALTDAGRLEGLAGSAKSLDEKRQFEEQAAALRAQAARPLRKETWVQEYWTDRNRFQVRLPRPDLPPDTASQLSFPDDVPVGDALATVFKQYEIASVLPSSSGHLVRLWYGADERGTLRASIRKGDGYPTEFMVPPLGIPNGVWDWASPVDRRDESHLHWFDLFFLVSAAELRLVGRETVNGRSVYVIEYVSKSANLRDLKTSDGKTVEPATVQRAYIDPSQGCLPLRLEAGGRIYVDGQPLRPHNFQPSVVVEVSRIESVQGAGFYPMAGVVTQYTLDPEYPSRSIYEALEDMLSKEWVPKKLVVSSTIRWEVRRLDANLPMPEELFSLEFPKNTHYFDAVENRTGVVGLTDEEVKRLAGEQPGQRLAPGRKWFVAGLATVAFVGAAVVFLLWKRARKR